MIMHKLTVLINLVNSKERTETVHNIILVCRMMLYNYVMQ